MKSYKIKLTYQGGRQNHVVNPLIKLEGRVYDTREEACEAIFSAMYDVIDGEHGCEMVDRPDLAAACDGIRVIDDESHGPAADPCWEGKVPTERESKIGCTTCNMVFGNDDPLKLRVEHAEEAGAILDNYSELCHDFILREGYASEDGVSASVEEVGVVFATIDERSDGRGDGFVHDYATEEDAVRAAERDWSYLTGREKSNRVITVARGLLDEDGDFDLGNYDVVRTFC